MKFKDWLVVGLLAGGFYSIRKNAIKASEEKRQMEEETQKRKRKHCHFKDGFSKNEFKGMVNQGAKKIERLIDV